MAAEPHQRTETRGLRTSHGCVYDTGSISLKRDHTVRREKRWVVEMSHACLPPEHSCPLSFGTPARGWEGRPRPSFVTSLLLCTGSEQVPGWRHRAGHWVPEAARGRVSITQVP